MSDLRHMIREILTDEIQALRASMGSALQVPVVREPVAVSSDYELNAFARHMISIADNPAQRAEFLTGRLQFTMNAGRSVASQYIPPTVAPATAPPMVTAPAPSSTPRPMPSLQPAGATGVRQTFDKGILTEKDVERLPQETRALTLGQTVRLTPLANDELRRRNIKIERKAA